jgi:hypothetical protein
MHVLLQLERWNRCKNDIFSSRLRWLLVGMTPSAKDDRVTIISAKFAVAALFERIFL